MRRIYRNDPETKRARERKRYHGLSGLEYNRRLLMTRRNKAISRILDRERRRGEGV